MAFSDASFFQRATSPAMRAAKASGELAFRYRTTDSATGVARETAKRLAERLVVDETVAIHLALREMVARVLPRHEADDGPLTAARIRRIRKRVPQGKKRPLRSSLFKVEPG